MSTSASPDRVAARLPRIVIVGAGFGGIACARALRHAEARVTIVDRRNFHLFQPLLYQVATGALSPADIAMPIRHIVRHQRNTRVILGELSSIDREARQLHFNDLAQPLDYDYLVVATGARKSWFGHSSWQRWAPGLKDVGDAINIRARLLEALERAETADDPDEQQRWLSFVVVGGGPSGVELAGAIAELAKTEVRMSHHAISADLMRITLAEAGPRLLAAFPSALARTARQSLEKLGVAVRTDAQVEQCGPDGVVANGHRLDARTILWTAGVAATPAASWLGVEAGHDGRIRTEADLSLPGDARVYLIGDITAVDNPDGTPVPGVAPAAKQEGKYVGKRLARRLAGRSPPSRFRYRDYGQLAVIGRRAAIADIAHMHFSGLPGWLLWGAAHILLLVGFRNRFAVAFTWLWSYLARNAGPRMLMEHHPEMAQPVDGREEP